MSIVHLAYPHGSAISCPDAIGRHLADRLGRRYRVVLHDWDDIDVVRPRGDAVLIGHPHPIPWTVFRMSSRLPGWRRIIALSPFAHGDPSAVAYADGLMRRCDLYLAITGPHWFRTIAASPVSHWAPKMVQVDLAVDRREFPRIVREVGPPGRRRFLYIGSTHPFKNVSYLSAIAAHLPGIEFSWIGAGRAIPGLRALGVQDFRTEGARRLIAEHDFLLTVGRVDANPATILEALAWGLVPVCTPQSGYEGEPWLVNVPLDDADRAAAILDDLQHAPVSRLAALRDAGDDALARRFTWDRVAEQLCAAIESSESPALGPEPLVAALALRVAAARAPHSVLRPGPTWRHFVRNASRLRERVRSRS
jgi:glycosyltransferase involved in cell wall biosynthesis